VGRKAGLELSSLPRDTKLLLEHPTEIELAKALLRFGDVLRDAADDLKPNLITEYLYGLSKAFNAFYDKKQGVKILDAGSEDIRHSRLLLCHITAETLRLGLALLGIKTVDAM
jgi:arginyl-tRNA synthetase